MTYDDAADRRGRRAPASPAIPLVLALGLTLGACGGGDEQPDGAERARARSEAVAAARWHYGQDTLPPEPGGQEARVVDRCRVTLQGGEAAPDTLDVACGLLFLALEPGTDSARVARLAEALDVEVVDRGALPAWSTELGEPLRYVLVRVEPGSEGGLAGRALASEGVRFIDVREVSRRRP